MYGDPDKIRQVAQRLEHRAERLRDDADDLHARSHEVEWVSIAAAAMQERAAERRTELRAVADAYEHAAKEVRQHAQRVQELLDRIAAIEQAVASAVAAAADRVEHAISSVADGIKDALTPGDRADQELASLQCPPPGHKDWLDMPDLVPGLRL